MNAAFLAAKGFLGIKNQWWLLAVFIIGTAAATLITITDNRDKRMVETAKDAGGNAAVIKGQRDVLRQVEQANEAENEIVRSGDAGRYERCLRDATPSSRAGCDRFRPVPD